MEMDDNPLMAKCACEACGGHLEFSIEGVDAVVPCPHCGQPTRLTAEPPAPTSGDRPTAAELMAAFGPPVARTPVSFFYQAGLLFVAGMMILLPMRMAGMAPHATAA